MKKHTLPKPAGVMIGAALIWSLGGAIGLALHPFSSISSLLGSQAQAASHEDSSKKDNPCNPRNPCNPSADAAQEESEANPCNPCAATAKDAAKNEEAENPCNPCAADATNSSGENPCNPDNPASDENGESVLAKESNPCNPCSAGGKPVGFGRSGGTMSWAKDYHSWPVVSGYVKSASHGNRLVQTFITPAESARIFKNNSKLVLERRNRGFQPYPQGTRIVQESWLRNDTGAPGAPGPIFFMRKETSGYDDESGDWHFGMAREDMTVIVEGKTSGMSVCKECHAKARSRDYVFSADR